jgi:ribonuclease HI
MVLHQRMAQEQQLFLFLLLGENHVLSFKFEFETTNNVVEYEALILGLEATKRMKFQNVTIFGDSELIIHQVKNKCQTRHPRMRAYKNQVWDLVDNFFLAINFTAIQRNSNQQADSLMAVSASLFKPPNSFC